MPRNDRSDSLSVRGRDDPRQPLRKLEQEAELELGRSEAGDTGGVEHRSRDEAARVADATGSSQRRAGPGHTDEGEGLGAPGSGSDGG
ncbi:MAG TPA: hypothetical protein VFP65_12655 [Anaeromyxobacteraceae bacterium]|nr:hypothetical protein [Anaeromyxobacteraceae bacterium]